MIGISVMNWFFGAGIGLLLTLGCVLSSVMWWKDEKTLSNHIGRNSCADTVVRTLCQPYLLVLSALCLCGTHHHSDHDKSSLYDGARTSPHLWDGRRELLVPWQVQVPRTVWHRDAPGTPEWCSCMQRWPTGSGPQSWYTHSTTSWSACFALSSKELNSDRPAQTCLSGANFYFKLLLRLSMWVNERRWLWVQ